MRLLYVSQYFPPEGCAPAVRVHALAREWVRQGHEVNVLTAFAHHPLGIKAAEDRGKVTRIESVDGIRVVRTYVYAAANRGTIKRMISYASFMLSAMTLGWLRVKQPDLVIATSPQLLCGLAGYVLARAWRVPFVFEVRDLWPESILAVDAMRDNLVIRVLRRVAAFLYAHSDLIVTVGEGYRRGIIKLYGTSGEKIAVVPNGIDPDLFSPTCTPDDIRKQFGWEDKFVVMYVGTHGMAHDLCHVLNVARLLREEPNKHFVFVGEGAEKDRLKTLAAEWKLENVQFIDQQPRERIAGFYAACNLGLVTLRSSKLFQEVLPSKLFEYLAMERPLLITVDEEARRLVEAANAGEYVPAGEAEQMAAVIRSLASEPGQLAEMGRCGRRFVVDNYDRTMLAQRYLELLKTVLRQPEPKVADVKNPRLARAAGQGPN